MGTDSYNQPTEHLGGGGGGWLSAGLNSLKRSGNPQSFGGVSANTTALGGSGNKLSGGSFAGDGGFGSGGGALTSTMYVRGGGGGGYSGGQGGSNGTRGGGGGGSFLHPDMENVATSDGRYNGSTSHNGSIQNLNSWNSGHGKVVITFIGN